MATITERDIKAMVDKICQLQDEVAALREDKALIDKIERMGRSNGNVCWSTTDEGDVMGWEVGGPGLIEVFPSVRDAIRKAKESE